MAYDDESAALHHQQTLEREQQAIEQYRNWSTGQLWKLYNAVMANAAAGDEHDVLAVIRYREGW